MRVLVVGGAGFIGGAVTNALAENNTPFGVYDSLVYEERYRKPVDFILGDVRDTKKLARLLPKYTHVIWLAAIVGDGACALHPEAAVEINELSVKWLADNFDGRIIFTSTCSVYGHNEAAATEDQTPAPMSLYAVTKVNAERYLKNKNALILRLGTAFGVSDVFSRPRFDLLVNTLAGNGIMKGKIMVFGGSQWRPNIHINDIAQIIVAGLRSPLRGIYNVATQNFTVNEIANKVAKITSCHLQRAGQLQEDKRNYRVSFDKALKSKLLRLPTKFNIEYGIKEVVALLQSGRVKDGMGSAYSNAKHLSNYSI